MYNLHTWRGGSLCDEAETPLLTDASLFLDSNMDVSKVENLIHICHVILEK